MDLLEIPESGFTPLITPGTKEDDAIKAAASQVDENVSFGTNDDGNTQADETVMDADALSQMLTGFLVGGTGALAARRGDHWLLTEDEVDMFQSTLDVYLKTALPDAQLTPGWAMIGVSLFIFAPKVIQDKAIHKKPLEHDAGAKTKNDDTTD